MPGMLYAAVEIAPVHRRQARVGRHRARRGDARREDSRAVSTEAVAVVADSLLARAPGARRAQAAVRRCRSRRRVDARRSSPRSTRRSAPPPDMPADAAQRSSPPTTACRFSPHATMEPMVCTARVDGDRAEVWAGVQDPLNARAVAADALGIDVGARCTFTNFMLGGGFGRRLAVHLRLRRHRRAHRQGDVAGAGEDDLEPRERHPARLLPPRRAWRDSPARSTRAARRSPCTRSTPAAATAKPCSCPTRSPRRTPTRRTRSIRSGPARGDRCSTRSTASSRSRSSTRWRTRPARTRSSSAATCWASSRASRRRSRRSPRCPAGARRCPRAKAAASRSAESFGTIVAEVAHVAVSPDGRLRCRRSTPRWTAATSSTWTRATAQVEGGIIFGLSAALLGEITIAQGRVVQSNFRDYQMIHIADAPQVTSSSSGPAQRSGGLGEPVRAADGAGGDQRDLRGDRRSACASCRSGRRR